MGNILNTERKLFMFQEDYADDYFVDKSEILSKLNRLIGKRSQNTFLSLDQEDLEKQ